MSDEARSRKKFPIVDRPADIAIEYLDDSRYAEFENNCEDTIYMHVEWPLGGISNFVLRPGETHVFWVGMEEPPCGCASRSGPMTDCGKDCNPILGGEYYEFC